MLIDKYLPVYDFQEAHSIKIKVRSTETYEKMLHCDVSESFLIRFLFGLRGIKINRYTISHIPEMGFIKLDEIPGQEIVYGMVTTSPMFNCCDPNSTPSMFLEKTQGAILKGVINFHLSNEDSSTQIISTETRIWCGTKKLRSKFRLYWFFVKPFSQLIRRSVLRQIKRYILESR
jgi:hypothetical protein